MANDYYNPNGYPVNSADGRSADMRAELVALAAAWNKLPPLVGNGDRIVLVNASGTALTVTPVGSYVNNVAWTPTLTCVTPGNLAVTYLTRIGSISRFGQQIKLSFSIQTSAFTHTTASGILLINGFPNITGTAFVPMLGPLFFSGLTKATFTNFVCGVNGANINVLASGSGVTGATCLITDFPTGGTVILNGTITYEGAN